MESNEEKRCCAGCISFTGGEVRHIKECVFYPESFSKMYDDLESKDKWISVEDVQKMLDKCIECAEYDAQKYDESGDEGLKRAKLGMIIAYKDVKIWLAKQTPELPKSKECDRCNGKGGFHECCGMPDDDVCCDEVVKNECSKCKGHKIISELTGNPPTGEPNA